MAEYASVKQAVISVIARNTDTKIKPNYKPRGDSRYNADTKLVALNILPITLRGMTGRFNATLRQVCAPQWTKIDPTDLEGKETISDLIWTACAAGQVPVPPGEPQ